MTTKQKEVLEATINMPVEKIDNSTVQIWLDTVPVMVNGSNVLYDGYEITIEDDDEFYGFVTDDRLYVVDADGNRLSFCKDLS